MRYLLDTDTWIFLLKGASEVEERYLNAGIDTVAISVITRVELTFGAYRSGRVESNLERVTTFCGSLAVLPLSAEVADAFGRLKAGLVRSGEPLEDFDILIAATALAYNLTLVTGNEAHFERVSGLRCQNWIQ